MNKVVSIKSDHKKTRSKCLGELLLSKGYTTEDEINIALHEQKRSKERLGETLVRLGFINDKELAKALAAYTGHDETGLTPDNISPEAMKLLPAPVAIRCKAAPIYYDGSILRLAMADPHDIKTIDEVRRCFPRGTEIETVVAATTDILESVEVFSRTSFDFEDILKELEGNASDNKNFEAQKSHPIVRLADKIILDAVKEGASDIHLEPENSFIRIRSRVDGVLRQKKALHKEHWPELSHRLKIMGGMNIADTRSMQDGRFQMTVGGTNIDFRMAIMPTVYGENIVIRILDHRRALMTMEELGYDAVAFTQITGLLTRPEGIVLVTGPTGSGKTTTLYALLKKLSNIETNIMTLEEPVEYRFDMIRQTAIQEQQGVTFAEGVRGILRQSPDIIFIGEIRDDDTAQMALRAAMTGHRVFSTLHCNDAFGAIPRLSDLGVSLSLLSENISGIISQRLVRRLCPKCKTTRRATHDELEHLKIYPTDILNSHPAGFFEQQMRIETTTVLAEPVGCDHCHNTGYKGRIAITEVLKITPSLAEQIASGAPPSVLRKTAMHEGFRSMRQDGIQKILNHETSISELSRKVDITRWS